MTTRAPFYWLNDISRQFLSRGYLVGDQTPEERIRVIAEHAETILGIKGFADKFYEYMSRGYYSLASPVWANYGLKRGLPVSCFGSYIDDNMESILYTHAEVGMLSKTGGGTSGYFGAIRGRGEAITDNGESSGSVHFMELFDKLTSVVSQGSTRRGYFAAYQSLDHKDAHEFMEIGTEGHPIQGMTTGVVVSDSFMENMISGDSDKRKLWAKVLKTRSEVGYPYIMFEDNMNRGRPDVYLDKDLKIKASNLCSEIALPSSPDETFTCVLSSINLVHWDEIKDTDAVETLVYFLDTMVTEFIEKTEGRQFFDRANRFAKRHRALGLGVLGWHSYLQSNMIGFESEEASKLNLEISKSLKEKTYAASAELAKAYGEPEVLEGYGRRNTTLMAIAPTKSSSAILGQVSQSIEPEFSNYYVKDLAKVKITVKNPYLETLLKEKGQDTREVWESIKNADGSVQHLEFLSEDEKSVFRTFAEIDPNTIIEQAAVRQGYIDQAQSINLMLDPKMPVKEINALYIKAWELGLKSLYYSYSISQAQALIRNQLATSGCVACEA